MPEEYKRHPNTQCLVCTKPIYKRPAEIRENNGRVFCSIICYGLSCRKEKPCVICGNPIQAGANKKTCSRSCANKNRTGIRYKMNQPKSKVRFYRILKAQLQTLRGSVCERCYYNKLEILEVHHKDRNRLNNNLDNLELICPNCHAEEHFMRSIGLTD